MASKVVVIDNDRQVRDVVCAALEDDGLVAVGMGSYPEAIEQLCWSPADLAISDGFTSDGVTGVSLLHRMFPRLRLVVLSGGVARAMKIPFATHGLSILPKPCSLHTLRQTVRETLMGDADACLQEIADRGRLGFLMAVLRSSPIGPGSSWARLLA